MYAPDNSAYWQPRNRRGLGNGLGFLAATTSPASPTPASAAPSSGGASPAANQPPYTALSVQTLLGKIGQSSAYKSVNGQGWCDCSSGKYCSSSSGPCPTDQYSGCAYWGGSVAQRLLCTPVPSAWVAGATNTDALTGGLISEAGGVTAGLTSGSSPLIAAGSAVPVVGTIVASIASAIGSLFGAAHAAAQRAQANAIAQGVPAANQLLQQIDSELSSGAITPAQATSLYSQIQSQFTNLMKQGTSYKAGDALWICDIAMQLVIAQRNQDLANGYLTGGATGPWVSGSGGVLGSSVSQALSSLGISSSWMPWLVLGGAAAAALLFL